MAAQTTAAGLRKEIILKSGMDKSEILKFFGDGDDILAIIDEMDNVFETTGVVQSRINVANGQTRFTPLRESGQPVSAGLDHVIDGHFDRTLANSRSVFSVTPDELKGILKRPEVVKSAVASIDGGQYVRTVNVGGVVGNSALKFGGNETTWIQIYTDKAGNLITTYPVPAPK